MMQFLKRLYVGFFCAECYESSGFLFLSRDAAKRDAESLGRDYYAYWRWVGIGTWQSWTISLADVGDGDDEDDEGD